MKDILDPPTKEEKALATSPPPSVTRFPSPVIATPGSMTNDEKIDAIEERFREILDILGLDLTDDSLAKTPYRIAKMYVNEIFSGLDADTFPAITFVENKCHHPQQSQMVQVKTGFISFCEHHFVPMVGHAYVAYIPNKKLIGLSKIPRIVQHFSHRPQLQERLTAQIVDCLSTLLQTDNVAVTITAKHYCILARGIKDEQNLTTTQVLKGRFLNDPATRQEYLYNKEEGGRRKEENG